MVRRIKPLVRVVRLEAEVRRGEVLPPSRRPGDPGLEPEWTPAADVLERDDRVVVEVELPGVRRDDVRVLLLHDRIEVSGRKREEPAAAGQRFHRLEREFGAFRRTIALPACVETAGAAASLENGILRVSLARAAKPWAVEVPVNPDEGE